MTTLITPSPEMVERAARAMEPGAFSRFDAGYTNRNRLDERAFLNAEKTVKAARRKATAAITAALSCPDGFRLVPVEPTPEMLKAYSVGLKNYISTFDAAERQARWGSPKKGRGFELPEWEKAIARYRAMLAASPAPAPQPISQDQDRG